MDSKERVVVIAGATSPTGKALARRFLTDKVKLALFSRDMAKLSDLRDELALSPAQGIIAAFDFCEREAAQAAAALVRQEFQRCDVLINLIGGWMGGRLIDEFEPNDYATMLNQHFWTTLYLVHAFLPLLRQSPHGRILIVSSPSAALPPAKRAPYAIAKAAQETLLLALAQETKGSSITANILRVNTIDTQGMRQRDSSPKTATWTTPEEISDTIFFLCSDAAAMINDARIPLYGSP